MKSKDYQDAVNSYTKSLELMEEAATYSNRAMAYLKLKNYNQVVDDANAALKIDSKYLKAYHRRGKAYFELRKYEQAIKDFQYILEREPENQDINQSLMDARYRLNNPGSEPAPKKAPSQAAPKPRQQEMPKPAPKLEEQKFNRVQIEEDSDEEEDEKVELK